MHINLHQLLCVKLYICEYTRYKIIIHTCINTQLFIPIGHSMIGPDALPLYDIRVYISYLKEEKLLS